MYTASKAALNALIESLALELQPINVRVSLVLPEQARETPFSRKAQAQMRKQGVVVPEAYSDFARSVFERITGQPSRLFTRSLELPGNEAEDDFLASALARLDGLEAAGAAAPGSAD